MVHEADPSLENPHSMPSSFFRASDGGAAAAALAPVNTRFGENESDLHVDAPPKGRRVAFDFSAFQKQHEEAAWTLTTFSSVGSAGAAAAAAPPQTAAAEHHRGLGRDEVAMTTTSRSTYPVAALPARHILGHIQPQHERQQQQQPLQQQDPGVASPRAPRPRLVVGPGRFGGKVGLLSSLQPPELIKYLTVSGWAQLGNVYTCRRHLFLLTYPYTQSHTNTQL